eukprot:2854329-Pleurochrysis_carterae.AAC.2
MSFAMRVVSSEYAPRSSTHQATSETTGRRSAARYKTNVDRPESLLYSNITHKQNCIPGSALYGLRLHDVPLPPPPVLDDELRRALHAVQEEAGLELTREYTRWPIRDPVVRRDSRPSASSRPTQFGSRPGRGATAAPVAAIHTEMGVHVRHLRPRSPRYLFQRLQLIRWLDGLRSIPLARTQLERCGPLSLMARWLFTTRCTSSFSLSECTRQIVHGMITSGWPLWRTGASISGRH